MNRHHPYGGGFESGPRRGGIPTGPGPDRSHRFQPERGGGPHPGRGGRGRGGGAAPPYSAPYNDGSGGYGQSSPTTSAPRSYNNSYGGAYEYGDPYGQGPSNANFGGGTNNGVSNYGQSQGNYQDGYGGGYNAPQAQQNQEEKIQDSLIEQRIQRERPCRTLFIRNIKYETNSQGLRRQFEEHGDIKTFFDLIANRGMVFVTYFDLRAAERARRQLQGTEIESRPIDVHYSLPRADEVNVKLDRDKNQASLLVTLQDSASRQPIDENELRRKCQQFGDVKAIKQLDPQRSHDQRVVEFYDIRSCEDAFDRLKDQGFQDGVIDTAMTWDIPDVPIPAGGAPNRRAHEEQPGGSRGGPRGRGRGQFRGRGGHRDGWTGHDDVQPDRSRFGPAVRGGHGGGVGMQPFNPPTGPASLPRPFSSGGPPFPPTGPANDGRLEQARQVQQLLAALKNPAEPPAPTVTPPLAAGNPRLGAPNTYYGATPPTYSNGVPPVPPSQAPPTMYPSSGPNVREQPAPPNAVNPAMLSGLPPNIAALLQAQLAQPQAAPLTSAAYPGPPGVASPPPGATQGAQAAGYQQLLSFLQAQAAKPA